MTHEERRLAEAREQKAPWKQWGPSISERQGGADINRDTGISGGTKNVV